MQDIAVNLARLRAVAKLSARELSRRAGLSPGYVARLERGEIPSPTLATIGRLAVALGVKVSRLLRGQK